MRIHSLPFTFRQAGENDLDSIAELGRLVRDGLPCRDMFETDDRGFYEAALKNKGSILLAEDGRNMTAGASVILFPDAGDPQNLGFDLHFDRAKRSMVRQLDSVFLRPGCRGTGLAGMLMRRHMQITARPDRPLDMATIWPGNVPSLRLFFSLGLTLRAVKHKYGGKPRFIALGGGGSALQEQESLELYAWDLEKAMELFRSGYAGTGVRTEENTGKVLIRYQKQYAGQ